MKMHEHNQVEMINKEEKVLRGRKGMHEKVIKEREIKE